MLHTGRLALLLLAVLGAAAAVDSRFEALLAAGRSPQCSADLCVDKVPCSHLGELLESNARIHRSQATVPPVATSAEKVAAAEDKPETSPTAPAATEATGDELSSTPAALDEVTEEARRRRSAQDEQNCYLAYKKEAKEEETPEVGGSRNTSWEVWLYGFLSVGFISLSGIFGIIFVPLMKKSIFSVVMRYLVGLGIGALSATSILQLIPECFQILDRNYLPASICIWTTVWVFFVFESVMKICLSKNESGHHGHSHSGRKRSKEGSKPIYKPRVEDSIEIDSFLPKSFENGNARVETALSEALPAPRMLSNDQKMVFHHRSHDYLAQEQPVKKKGLAAISSVAWMIILGDGIHNFIDGVSIGAGFTQSTLTGVSISLAIIFEEFPHELGDFAILINSGMSVKKALAFNFASACTAFLGLVLGILLESFEINSFIFGLAGGLFLYIALSDLIPQLNIMIDEALEDEKNGKTNAVFIMIQQNLGILTGMGLIYVIAKYGHLITIG